jgi:hypothetical protein
MDLSGRLFRIAFPVLIVSAIRLTPLFKAYFPLLPNGAAVPPAGFTREISSKALIIW